LKYSSILLLSLLMLAQAVLASTVEHRLGGTAERGEPPLACGDLSYDDGTAEDAIFFGGGDAGRPNHFLGIRFELADFGIPLVRPKSPVFAFPIRWLFPADPGRMKCLCFAIWMACRTWIILSVGRRC